MLDIAVIGAGPAGLSAAINCFARNKNVGVFGKNIETSAAFKAKEINNHLGMPSVSGSDMMNSFYNHVKKLGIPVNEGRVLQIYPQSLSNNNYFTINFENKFIDAKAVILAMGAVKGDKIAGEDEFLGKGVSYCATCDGMLYRGKTVYIIGETAEADEDANFLSEICEKTYYLPKHKTVKPLNDKIELLSGKPEAVIGDEYVTGIVLDGSLYNCDGVFLIKDNAPASSLIQGLEIDGNVIKVNREMATNIPGVFACGDCVGWPLQVSAAVGEGLTAAQSVVRWLG